MIELADSAMILRMAGGRSGVGVWELSPREREVLQLMRREGDQGSGAELHVSIKTAETHRRNVMEKLKLESVAELTNMRYGGVNGALIFGELGEELAAEAASRTCFCGLRVYFSFRTFWISASSCSGSMGLRSVVGSRLAGALAVFFSGEGGEGDGGDWGFLDLASRVRIFPMNVVAVFIGQADVADDEIGAFTVVGFEAARWIRPALLCAGLAK